MLTVKVKIPMITYAAFVELSLFIELSLIINLYSLMFQVIFSCNTSSRNNENSRKMPESFVLLKTLNSNQFEQVS